MGYLGISLDTTMVILSSIAIGIGVDDTIHFLKTYRYEKRRGLSQTEALINTYREAGRAIIYTSAALILGFSATLFSSFVPVINLGFLIMGVMIATTLGALLFLPAVLKLSGLHIEKVNPLLDKFSPGAWLLSEKEKEK